MSGRMKVLIGDNTVELGMMFSKYLNSVGIDSFCRRNDPQQLYNDIDSEKPDAVILSVFSDNGETARLAARLRADFPDIRVIAITYISDASIRRELIRSGAERCILMPSSMREIYRALTEPTEFGKIFDFEPVISGFLEEAGFPMHLNGFRYLCIGVGFCIIDPDLTSDITGALYQKVADVCHVNTQVVERTLRHVAVIISKSGADKRLLGGDSSVRELNGRHLTNYELICAAADAFAQRYHIFDE